MSALALPADWHKLAIFVGCAAGLYWLVRRISLTTDVQYPPGSQNEAEEPLSSPPPRLASALPPLPSAPELGPIRVLNMYFAGFDLAPGPADPKRFSDELFLELENTDSGFRWRDSYQVATPAGLAAMLEANGWQSAYIDSLIVVPRYDLVEIWHAVVQRLVEEQQLTHAGEKGPPIDNT